VRWRRVVVYRAPTTCETPSGHISTSSGRPGVLLTEQSLPFSCVWRVGAMAALYTQPVLSPDGSRTSRSYLLRWSSPALHTPVLSRRSRPSAGIVAPEPAFGRGGRPPSLLMRGHLAPRFYRSLPAPPPLGEHGRWSFEVSPAFLTKLRKRLDGGLRLALLVSKPPRAARLASHPARSKRAKAGTRPSARPLGGPPFTLVPHVCPHREPPPIFCAPGSTDPLREHDASSALARCEGPLP
jgi:hypothetical protein